MALLSLRGTSRFLHAYYVGHALLIASYWPLRTLLAEPAAVAGPNARLFNYEQQAAAMMVMAFALKATRTHSADHLVSIMFSYANTGLLLLAYFASPTMLAIVAAEVACLFLLTGQPLYDAPTAAEVLTPVSVDALAKAPGSPAWVILLYASWHAPCVHFMPAFARLADAHASEALHFGMLDLGRWPGLASRYGIDMNATTSQLPTVVLFENGAEADRMPRRKVPRRASGAPAVTGEVVKGRWGATELTRAFDLERRSAKRADAKADKKSK